jgi:CSLREA domain-containing protein
MTMRTPTLSIGDATVTEGIAGTVNATFTVTLSAVSSRAVTVNFATAGGTAAAPADFAANSGTLTFAPGETSKTIIVAVAGDGLDEANETFNVNLTAPVNATIADGIGVGTITDDDAAPTLSINDVTVTEGNTTTVNASFTVTLSAVSGQAVTVNFATANGTAVQPGDYVSNSGLLTFAPGETTKTVNVVVAGDLLDELDETFNVNLTSAVNATLNDGVGLGTITDNDATPTITLSSDKTTIAEPSDTVTFTATLSAASGRSVIFDLGFSGTATLDADYTRTGTGSRIVIAPGQLTASLAVTAARDTLDEQDETIIVDITTVTNAIEATPQQATVTLNDDSPRLFVVTTAVDELNFNNTAVSLREAIEVANRNRDVSTITFDASLNEPIILTRGELVIRESTIITGRGINRTVIDGGAISRVFNVTSRSGDVTFNDLTINNGEVGGEQRNETLGAGIRFESTGTLSLVNTVVSNNANRSGSASATGGGIFASLGTVTIVNSTISGNSAKSGGGVYAGAALNVTNSTFHNNSAEIGGAIFSKAITSINNSTISTNTASREAGAIKSNGSLTLTHSTVAGNRSIEDIGGIDAANLTVLNSILADNTDRRGASNLGRSPQSIRFSIVDNQQGISLPASPVSRPDRDGNVVFTPDANGNFIGSPTRSVDPKIGELEFNGGPTMTHDLLPGSLAINAGDPATATTPATDQRGLPFVRRSGRLDIGSVESQALAPAMFVVTTANDELDFSNSLVSLREAITIANIESNVDNITFATSVTTPINLTLDALKISNPVNITGRPTAPVAIDAGQKSRVFEIEESAGDVTLSLLTIRNGKTTLGDQDGGGIFSASTALLTLRSSTVSGNSVANVPGSPGVPAVQSRGGGIAASNVLLVNSTVSGNSAAAGGGIAGSDITAINSTLSGNTATSGGAIDGDSVILTNSTVTLNTSSGRNTGAIDTNNAKIHNTIVSGNLTALNPAGTDIVTNGAEVTFSLIGDLQSNPNQTLSSNNQFSRTPRLGPLQTNGGATFTHALLTGSRAIDGGRNALAIDEAESALLTDQRGVGFARISGPRIDIGAFEAGTQPVFDFGDAPSTFPVLLANDGARHAIGSLKLGTHRRLRKRWPRECLVSRRKSR